MSVIPGRTFVDVNQLTLNKTVVATLADINAGTVILPACPGCQFELTSIHMLVTGTFTTLTDLRLSTTESTPTDILTVVAAQLGTGAIHSHLTGTNTLAAAFWAALAQGYGIQVRKTGGTAAGGTSVTIKLGYKIIKPA